jgi:NADPH-dependent glutamate synthase beta subunit-like oxidoreductase
MLVDDGSGSFSGSFEGDGSNLTGIAAGGFPHTGSAAISGTLNVTGSGVTAVDVSGTLLVSGAAFVESLTETSALRYKENISEMDSQLNTVYSLRPVDFVWKATEEKDKGLIAEEVRLLYPEFVTLNTDGTTQGIKYSKLVSVLIKSIQELKDEVEILKLKIDG